MHNIKELKIWHKAIDLAVVIYDVTALFPQEEKYGLITQMRRCSVSISSNISEGAGRNTKGEFVQFLGVANGSTYELQTQVVIAKRLEFIESDTAAVLLDKLDELQKMIYKLQHKIKGG